MCAQVTASKQNVPRKVVFGEESDMGVKLLLSPHGKAGRRGWLTCGALGEWPGEGRQQGSVAARGRRKRESMGKGRVDGDYGLLLAGQPLARVEEGQEVRAVREWKGADPGVRR